MTSLAELAARSDRLTARQRAARALQAAQDLAEQVERSRGLEEVLVNRAALQEALAFLRGDVPAWLETEEPA